MTRRALALVAVALLVVPAVALVGSAVAQTDERAGQDYTLDELERGGLEKAQGPSSQRYLSDYGSAVIRYTPVGPLTGGWDYLEPGATIHPDSIQLRTVRLAPSDDLDRTLNVTIVAWERGEREVVTDNQTVTRPAAVNQTVHRQQVTLNRGYDNASLDLPDNLDRTAEMTVWIDEYPDARWRFKHHGLPTQQSVSIDSQGDALGYAGMNALLPGLLGVVVGIGGARATLRQTATGPRLGLAIWGIAAALALGAIFSFAYFQLSVVLSILPVLVAAPLAIVAFGMTLWAAGAPKRIGFERLDLETVRDGPDSAVLTADQDDGDGDDGQLITDGGRPGGDDPLGEQLDDLEADLRSSDVGKPSTNGHSDHETGTGLRTIKEERYVDLLELPAKETSDGRILVPKPGIRPFLARLFADPAELEKKNLMTKVSVDEGRLDEKVLVDPDSDEVIEHTPARITRRWPVLHGVDSDDGRLAYGTAILGFITIVFGLPLAGWAAGSQAGIPAIGGVVAMLPALVAAHTAKRGAIDFEPAAQHFQRARSTLVDLQREHADAKHIKEKDAEAARERARTAKEAMEHRDNTSKTLTEELLADRAGYPYVGSNGHASDGGDGDE